MATITTSKPIFYKDGVGGVSAVVGYETGDRTNRVARYTFTAPPDGASHISLSFGYASIGDSQCHKEAPMRFAITKTASHDNAGATAAYDGTLSIVLSNGVYVVTGSADIMLMPGESYYLYLFPGSTTYCWWYWSGSAATIQATGAAGVVYIDTGTAIVRAIPYIDNGSTWKQTIPYRDSGSALKPSS